MGEVTDWFTGLEGRVREGVAIANSAAQSGHKNSQRLKHERPALYENLKLFSIGALKTIGLIGGSYVAGHYLSDLISSIPAVGQCISNITTPAVIGAAHWTLSDGLFGNGPMNRGFDFVNKWWALSSGISGVVNGATG